MEADNIIGVRFHRNLYADLEKGRVFRDGEELANPLTGKEFEVLVFFLRRPQTLIRPTEVTPLDDRHYEKYHRYRIDNYRVKISAKLGLESQYELWDVQHGIGCSLVADVHPVYAIDREHGAVFLKASDLNFNSHTIERLRLSLNQSLKALEINPHGLPGAHVTAAYNLINLSQAAHAAELPATAIPQARQHALQALKHRETEAAAHGVLALISLIYDYNWTEAEKEFDTALSLNPDESDTLLSYAHLLVGSGRTEKAFDAVDKAARLCPDNLIIYASRGWFRLLAGKVDEAITMCKETLDLYPDFAPGHMMLGWSYEAVGNYSEALLQYRRSEEAEASTAAFAALGHLYGKLGQRAEALQQLASLDLLLQHGTIKYVPAYCRALIFAGLCASEECLAELERAYDESCDWLIHLQLEKRWDPVRGAPQFRNLVTKVGLPYLPDIAK